MYYICKAFFYVLNWIGGAIVLLSYPVISIGEFIQKQACIIRDYAIKKYPEKYKHDLDKATR